MTDAALAYDDDIGGFDLLASGSTLAGGSDIVAAVIVSLFSDRRADADDRLPDAGEDRRGWWADSYTDAGKIGARLWLLGREKLLPGIEQRIEEYAREALQWLIDDGLARQVQILAERHGQDTVALQVAIIVDTLPEIPMEAASQVLVIDGLNVELLLRIIRFTERLGKFPEFEES